MQTQPTGNEKPEGLSPDGEKAYEIVLKVMKDKGFTYTGGCKTFYNPDEWIKTRGEVYGQGSELIVVYDGSSVKHLFSIDSWEDKFYEAMEEALKEEQFYWEECTNWYSAIYKR